MRNSMRIMRKANIPVNKEKVIHPELSYAVNAVLFKVRKDLGRFCNEQQYSDAIEKELQIAGIVYEREKILPISFVGEHTGRNKADFVIEGKILLEIKAKQFVTKEDYYQVQRYLNALKLKLGIIVNMRSYYIHPKRIINFNIS